METIKVIPGHSHVLVLCVKKKEDEIECGGCGRLIVGSAYGCEPCFFYIHRSCAQLAPEIHHPFHPQHPLILLPKQPYGSEDLECSACGQASNGFTFHCSECKFDLDVACAALTPSKLCQGHQNQIYHLLGDPHPLVVCDHNDEYSPFLCSACSLPIQESIYVCRQCKHLLHKSCASLPEEIKHPFHPEHPLFLLPQTHYECSACRRYCTGYTYNCSKCEFDLDAHCVSLIPTIGPDQQQQTQQLSHIHPLILCNKTTNFPLTCSACDLPFEDSIYVCLLCKVLLHKSCAELPRELKHPFHELHSLTLLETSKWTKCRACRGYRKCFAYVCLECGFKIESRCSWPIPPFIKSDYHEHPLAFLKIEIEDACCNSCGKPCHTTTFRCAECKLNLHLHCNPNLPRTIKHICHLHSLTFTSFPIKDFPDEDEDAEFFCAACEEKRDLVDPTYYCAECHYVAHVQCVISEVLRLLEQEWSLTCKICDTKLITADYLVKENTNEVEAEIEELHKEVDAEGKKLKAQEVQVMTQRAKLEELESQVRAQKQKLEALKLKLAEQKRKLEALRKTE